MRRPDFLREMPVEAARSIPAIHRFGLWAAAIYFIYPSAMGLLILILIRTGVVTLPPRLADSMPGIWTWQFLSSCVIHALNLVGGVLLLYHRRVAPHILLASAGIVAIVLPYYVFKGLFPTPGMPTIASYLTYFLMIMALAYVYLLRQRGILNR
jgi:hypothetical protein